MADKGYEVTVEELTVHQTVSKLPQPDGSFIYQNGLGQTYVEGDVLMPDQVAEDWREALDKGEGPLYEALKDKLKPTSGEESKERSGVPFEGYDDMSESDVLAAMRNLPSATVQRIKRYEATRDEPRAAITGYSIGFGEHPDERQLAEVEIGELDEDKPAKRVQTREVPDDGPVKHGEGITGTGEPPVEPGTAAAAEEEETKTPARGNVAAARRGRRERTEGESGSTPPATS